MSYEKVSYILHPGKDMDANDEQFLNDYVEQSNEKQALVFMLSTYSDKPLLSDILNNVNRIKDSDEIKIFWKTSSRELLFNFGMVFAARKPIKLLNPDYVDDIRIEIINNSKKDGKEVPGKSYEHVAYMLNFYQNLINVVPVSTNKQSFLIRPVREAPENIDSKLKEYSNLCDSKGFTVHNPSEHTNQIDPVGINICAENRSGIENAKEVLIYRLNSSEGSDFDKGMTIYSQKPAFFVNHKEVRENPSGRFDNAFLELHDKSVEENPERFKKLSDIASVVGL